MFAKKKISQTDLNVTFSINAINHYLLRGSKPDCSIMLCKNVTWAVSKPILILIA